MDFALNNLQWLICQTKPESCLHLGCFRNVLVFIFTSLQDNDLVGKCWLKCILVIW